MNHVMHRKLLITLFSGCSLFSVLGCVRAGTSQGNPDGNTVRMTINHYQAPCVGEASQLCLLAKEDGQRDWDFLFEGISGFQFQWGKVYELEVEKIRRRDVKADESEIAYRLIRIISSEDAAVGESFPLVINSADVIAAGKPDNGQFTILRRYPLGCGSRSLCDELEKRLRSQTEITGQFQHSPDKKSLVLHSLN